MVAKIGRSGADGLAREGCLDGAKGAERVEGLDEPAVGVGLLGQKDIDVAIKQQKHWAIVEIFHDHALLDGDARGHAAHVANLKIE